MMQVVEQSISDGHPMTPDQIYDKVLEIRSNYVYSLGVGPYPEKKEFLFYVEEETLKGVGAVAKHNQEMKNEIVDIKAQMKHQ